MKLDMPYAQDKVVEFDFVKGEISEEIILDEINAKTKGNCHVIEGNIFALYEKDDSLFFQVNSIRWDLNADDLIIKYHHIVSKEKTFFSVESTDNSYSLEYAAWWSDIPDFKPIEPEIDEEEDYLAYIFNLAKDSELKGLLLSEWKG